MPYRAAWLLGCAVCSLSIATVAAEPDPPDVCPTDRPVPTAPSPRARAPKPEGPTFLRADQARSLDKDVLELRGNAEVRRDDERVASDYLRYDRAKNYVEAPAGATLSQPSGARYTTDDLSLDLDTRTGTGGAGTYRLTGRQLGRGDVSRTEFLGADHTRLYDVRYTTCPEGRDDWYLRAGRLDLDTTEDIGVARNVTLNLFGLPVLYLPYLSFPISDERKSGFLFPQLGYGSRLGAVVATPYYLNLAPNYDATLTPRVMTDRGLQLQTEFRYLGRRLDGQLDADYLPDDDVTGEDRWAGRFVHRQSLGAGWSGYVNAHRVSDEDYLSDFGDNLDVTSQSHLPQEARLAYRGPVWAFTARASDYQTVDRSISPASRPYARLPQLLLTGATPSVRGPQYRFEGELVDFDHDVRLTGSRANLSPSFRWPLRPIYGFFVPEVGVRHIAYSLDDVAPERRSVTAPFASLDAGLYFDRTGERFDATLEPRLYYLYVPFREQDDLPNFDTTLPDFTFASLFRNNRFLGGDRIGDANQATVALTTRLIEAENGVERLRASVGRTHYFDDRRVNLPAGTITQERSDIAAESVAWLRGNWHARASSQWSPEEEHSRRSTFYFQYQPAADRILNFGYRHTRRELRQLDLSFEWPLSARWVVRGRSLYSLRDVDHGNVDSFLGAEYRSCCWALRLYATRGVVQTAAGSATLTESRSQIVLEFELSGLSRIGGGIESPLGQGLFFAAPRR